MKTLIYNLLQKLSCLHKWNVHYTTTVWDNADAKLPFERRQTLICKNCGKIKQIEV